MYIDEILCGHYEVLQIPYALYTIKQRTELLSLADKETRTAAEILDEMETKLQQLNREDFQTIRAMIDPEQRINISEALKFLLWDYEFYLSSLTAMKEPAFTVSTADWKRFDKIITERAVELDIIPKGKIAYPSQDDKVTIPVLNSFMMNADNVLSDNGEKIILNKQQYRLLSAVRIAVKENEEHGDGQHLFTLDSIVRYWKGKGAETIPTQAEREQVANMLDFFFNINAYTYTNTGQRVKFKFMHMDIVEKAEIHGTVTNAYRIYNVFTPPSNHEIQYYQFSLPKGYLNNLENVTLWAEIIDKSRKTTDNHKIDFESICRKLGVTKNNRKKRHDLYQKIIDMIKYYNFSNMSIESSYHGTLSIEEIK